MQPVYRGALLFGKVINSDLPQALKVRVTKYVMDEKLTMYFKEHFQYYAYGDSKACKEGDYVMIRELSDSDDKNITHTVESVVYKLGHYTDPISGKRSAGTEYIDDIKRTSELFGMKPPYL